MILTTFSQYEHNFQLNRAEWASHLPKSAQAAEATNQAFQTFLQDDIRLPLQDLSGYALALLSFGAYSSWVDAHLQATSGQLPSAWADLRRAIEFTCYSAKVKGNEKRSKDWIDQKDDGEAQRRFSLQCSMPLCYSSEKYRNLRRLMVAQDWANYYGAHGGFETLLGSQKDFVENQVQFTHPANRIDIIVPVSGYIVILGLEILEVLTHFLKEFRQNPEAFSEMLKFAQDAMKAAKEEIFKAQFGSVVPDSVQRVFQHGNQEVIDDMFSELLDRARKRKSKTEDGSVS